LSPPQRDPQPARASDRDDHSQRDTKERLEALDALAGALPDRTRDELVLDFQFFIGAMVHVISGHTRIEGYGARPPLIPDEWVLRRMGEANCPEDAIEIKED
jgi:hypothetical protein